MIPARIAVQLLVAAFALAAASALAQVPEPLASRGSVQVDFSPWDDTEGMIVTALRQAKQQILVQAYSFTSRNLAAALLGARRRGVEVRVIADFEQTRSGEGNRIGELAAGGVPVLMDTSYQSAHSKVMIIDAESDHPAVITGSYNWTYAARHLNAENVLILRDNPELARAYLANWRRHAAGSSAYPANP